MVPSFCCFVLIDIRGREQQKALERKRGCNSRDGSGISWLEAPEKWEGKGRETVQKMSYYWISPDGATIGKPVI